MTAESNHAITQLRLLRLVIGLKSRASFFFKPMRSKNKNKTKRPVQRLEGLSG